MKKHGKTIGCTIATIFLVFSLIPISNLLTPRDANSNIRGFYYEDEYSLDLVCIGASSTIVFWIPLQVWNDYGIASYNLASSSMAPQAYLPLMKEATETQHPKLWVIDLRPFRNIDKDVWFMSYVTLGMNFFSPNRIAIINATVDNAQDRIIHYLGLLYIHTNWFRALRDIVRQGIVLREEKIWEWALNIRHNWLKGFALPDMEAPVHFTEASDFIDWSNVEDSMPIAGEVLKYFIDLLEYCKQKEQQVLFVVTPYCQEKEDKKKFNFLKGIIESYGFEFLNTNDYWGEINLDFDLDFSDRAHVNIFGAEKYTRFLAQYIVQKYDMPDHRKESAYQEWNNLYVRFSEQAKNSKNRIREIALLNQGLGTQER